MSCITDIINNGGNFKVDLKLCDIRYNRGVHIQTAILKNRFDIIKYFHSRGLTGSDIRMQNCYALCLAIEEERVEIFKYFFDQMGLTLNDLKIDRFKPLILLGEINNRKMINYVLKKLNLTDKDIKNIVKNIDESRKNRFRNVFVADEEFEIGVDNCFAVLGYAVMVGNMAIVSHLICSKDIISVMGENSIKLLIKAVYSQKFLPMMNIINEYYKIDGYSQEKIQEISNTLENIGSQDTLII